ncbi:MAG: iron-containing alcohol dehydrogenase [Thermodesulfobacteriota bacterium]|nr:iron-containing alcohol dehydrogenase [Thermodesulfobacteriota bacterium]
MMYPDVAIVDPSLTQSMPKNVTAFTGMDALTQLIESFVSKSANPYTDALCKDGIARISRSFKSAFDNGEDLNARTDISLAALFSGIALANAKLGAVHGIAGPMGGMIKAPHGLICARLLALVMEENVKQLRKNDSHSSALIKFQEVAGLLTADKEAAIEDGTEWIRDLVKYMKIPCLSDFGLDRAVCRSLGDKALKTSSIKGNPVELTREQITAILEKR